MTGGAGAIRAGRAYVEAFLDKSKLEEGLKNAQARMQAFSKQVAIIGGAMSAMGASIVGPMTLAVKHFAAVGSELTKVSLQTGASVEELSRMRAVASRLGIETDDLTGSIEELNIRLGETLRDGAGPAAEALKQLGLDAAQLADMPLPQRFGLIADALERIQNQATRGFMADEIFGGDAFKILPLLRQGSAGLQEMIARAEELGQVMSTEDATAAAEMTVAMGALKRSLDSVKLALGRDLIPMAQKLVHRLTEVVQKVRAWVSDNKPLAEGLAKLGIVLTGVGAAMLALATASKAFAIAKAAALALSGPGGMLALAAGMAAVGLAVNELNSLLDDSTRAMNEAAKAASGAGDEFEKMGNTAESVAKQIAELEKRQKELKGKGFLDIAQGGLFGLFADEGEIKKIAKQLKELQELQKELSANRPEEEGGGPAVAERDPVATARKEAIRKQMAEAREGFGDLQKELQDAGAKLFPNEQLRQDFARITELEDRVRRNEELGVAAPGEFERLKPLFKAMEKEALDKFNAPAKQAEEEEKRRLDSIAGVLEGLEDDLLDPLERQIKNTVDALEELEATPDEIKKAQDLITKAFEEEPEKEQMKSFSAPGGTFSQLASRMFGAGPMDMIAENTKSTAKHTKKIAENTKGGITFKE